MPGFMISTLRKSPMENFYNDRCIQDSFSFEKYYVARNTLNKFLDDKCFSSNDDFITILDGVLTNKTELFSNYQVQSVEALLIQCYKRKGTEFFHEFRGSFAGALYDKSRSIWIIFTNQTGDCPLFYYLDEEKNICIGSQVNYLLAAMEENGIGISIDEAAIISMLTYGYMYDDFTYAKEIKRLLPGMYILIEDDKITINSYFNLKGHSNNSSCRANDELIDELDNLFRAAIDREFRIDDEYGYRHLSDISGGLDSRMVNWVAHKAGFRDIVNICYSQSGYADEVIATQISTALGNDMLFKPQDSASFLLRPERIINMNYGLGLYSGITAGEELLNEINISLFGVEHTGQLGDVIIGCFLKSASKSASIQHGGLYSLRLAHLLPIVDSKDYFDQEEYLIFVRGFLGCQSSHLVRRNYTEVLSPFTDVDFMKFCLSLPIDKRANHKLYREWILTKHPDAAAFIWEQEGVPVDSAKIKREIKRFQKGITRLIAQHLPKSKRAQKGNMNPFSYWIENLPTLKDFLTSSFDKYFAAIPDLGEVNEWIRTMFVEGEAIEKTMALTAVMACRYYLCFGKAWEL